MAPPEWMGHIAMQREWLSSSGGPAGGGRFSELSLVQLTRNMTEWSASNQRHWPVSLMLRPNYNINLQLSRALAEILTLYATLGIHEH